MQIYWAATKLCYIIGRSQEYEVGVKSSLMEPVRNSAGNFLTPHLVSGIVRSMSHSFAFIIPLDYGIIAKNYLESRAKVAGNCHSALLLRFEYRSPEVYRIPSNSIEGGQTSNPGLPTVPYFTVQYLILTPVPAVPYGTVNVPFLSKFVI